MRSGIEPGAQARRHDGAEIVTRAKDSIADTSDEIVAGVAKRARNEREKIAEKAPSAAEAKQDVDRSIGADEERSVAGEDDDAVRQTGATLGRHAGLERLALERREAEGAAFGIVPKDKQDGAMAEAAVAVVEKQLGLGRIERQGSEKNSTRGGASRRGASVVGRARERYAIRGERTEGKEMLDRNSRSI
jgi:hypothetical protein